MSAPNTHGGTTTANHPDIHHSAGHHGPAETFTHYAHYAHHAHLIAEGAEVVAHMTHVVAAQKLIRTHAQMSLDLKRMARHLNKLRALAREGGAAGETAAWRLIRAHGLFGETELAFRAERPFVEKAIRFLGEAKSLRFGARGMATARIGKAALALETVLRGSQVGCKLLSAGRIVTSKAFVNGLVVIGSLGAAVESYQHSGAETQGGKLANAALGGGAGYLTMANPWVAAVDLAAPKGYKPGELYSGTADELTAIGESIALRDMKPLDDLHKRSMAGAHGKVLQAASEAGEFWSKRGFSGGMKEFAYAVRWWVAN